MLTLLCGTLFLTGVVPLWRGWRANRATSLTHALAWAAAAWLAWGGVWLATVGGFGGVLMSLRYMALCLIGCACVAVLGARRPGVGAWNFVVGGLLAVQLLFLAEGLVVGGELQLGIVRTAFLAITLAVGVLNYLPTRLAPAAIILGMGCSLELWCLTHATSRAALDAVSWQFAELLVLAVPWVAFVATRRHVSVTNEVDGLWRNFRDSFGVVWGQRLREQFNRAAANANVQIELDWFGLNALDGSQTPQEQDVKAGLNILLALLKRFGPEAPAEVLKETNGAKSHDPSPPHVR